MRKAALCCGAFSAAVFLCQYLLPRGYWLALAAVGALCLPAGLLTGKRARRALWLAALGAAAGGLCCWVQGCLVAEPAEALAGETCVVRGRVLEYPQVYEDSQYVVVRLISEDVPRVKCRLASYEGGLAGLEPGDEISLEVEFRSAVVRNGQETDVYTSRNVFLLGICRSAPAREGRWALSFLFWPGKLANAAGRLCRRLFPEDVQAFMTALLTGDKTALYEDAFLTADLSGAGLSHVVAVSGMHVAYLMGLLRVLLGGRRYAFAGLPVLVVFAAAMGFTPSVVRAAFMQMCLLAAPLTGREGDSPTALAVILALLLAVNPSAARSASLQLSFAATAGILLLSGKMYRGIEAYLREHLPRRAPKRGVLWAAGSVSTTFGALVFTVPLTAAQFGTVSVVSPVTNVLCLWMISILFLGGYAVLAAGALLPGLGSLLGRALAWGARYVFGVAGVLTKLPCAQVWLTAPAFVLWLAFVYIIFLIAWFYRQEGEKFRPIMPVCLSVIGLCAAAFSLRLGWKEDMRVTVLDVGQGACAVLESGTDAVVVDCGGTWDRSPGQEAAGYLLGQMRTHVDALVLTHLHSDHCNGVADLLARVQVDCLFLPVSGEEERGVLEEVLDAADRAGTRVEWVEEDVQILWDNFTLTLWAPEEGASGNENGLMVLGARNGFEVLITGDAPRETERLFCARTELPDTEVLVVGHHGSATSTSTQLLEAARPDIAVISVGYNTYGHPSPEVLTRLAAYNIEVLRTDTEGTVQIAGGEG